MILIIFLRDFIFNTSILYVERKPEEWYPCIRISNG